MSREARGLAGQEEGQQHPEGDGHRCLHHLGSDFERHHAKPPPCSAPCPSQGLHGVREAGGGPNAARSCFGCYAVVGYWVARLRLGGPSTRSAVSCPDGHGHRRVRCPARHASPPRPQGSRSVRYDRFQVCPLHFVGYRVVPTLEVEAPRTIVEAERHDEDRDGEDVDE